MADDRVTETPHTTVIERSGGGGGILIGIVLLIAVAIGAFYLFNQSQNDAIRTDAVAGAAKDVGDSAKKVGDSAQKGCRQRNAVRPGNDTPGRGTASSALV